MRICSIYSFCILATASILQAALTSGPMLAHLEMREAKVWVQTDAPSLVRVAYAPEGNNNAIIWSNPAETDSSNANTSVVTLDQVEPGTSYSYRIELNGELVTEAAKFTTPANYFDRSPPPNFRIAVGGAHYVIEEGFEPPYRTLGGGYDIFSSIAKTEPALMLWVGDTAHLRRSDWTTKSGYLKRFAKARSVPQLGPLLQSIPHYATWGGTDFGAPNSGRLSVTRDLAENSFKAFWPRPIEVSQLDGIATQFRYADVDFFMLDARSYRNDTPDSSTRVQILGKEQMEWLRHALIQSTATFKVIIAGSPILNPADSRENLSYAEREHTEFLQMFRDEQISGLFFISGGKPYGELTRLVHANSYNLHDLTLGPLTATPAEKQEELNFFRMPGSSIFERHFALVEFGGPEEDRHIIIRTMNVDGEELWNRTLKASELKPAER